MKKCLSIFLAVLFIASILSVSANAADDSSALRFNENSEFKILHISDCQDDYPAEEKMIYCLYYGKKNYL